MNQLEAEQLLRKFQAGQCTPEELIILDDCFFVQSVIPQDLLSIESDLAVYKEQLKRPSKPKSGHWSLNILYAAAAIVVIAGVFTVLFSKNDALPSSYANDINPGGNKASLTFQNGQTIQLSDTKEGVVIDATKLSYSDGTVINHEVSQTFTVSTPRGGTYQVRLPDSTKVWLNAESSLTYTGPSTAGGQFRNVKLKGEAYFEVSKNIECPFIVSTEHQKLEVLGTQFGVSAYSDERSTKTTLLEGSIAVTPLADAGTALKAVFLTPHQESTLTEKGISVRQIGADDGLAWKDDEFSFSRENLESIMKKIERWYDVEVDYSDEKLKTIPFSGTISKFKTVSQVLCLLENTGEVRFKVEERRIIVMK